MRDVKFAVQVGIVLLVLATSRAFGGFTDSAYGGEVTASTNNSETTETELDFEITSDRGNEFTPPMHQLTQRPTPPAAAPLPLALLPGGAMLIGSFLATRVLKKRIV